MKKKSKTLRIFLILIAIFVAAVFIIMIKSVEEVEPRASFITQSLSKQTAFSLGIASIFAIVLVCAAFYYFIKYAENHSSKDKSKKNKLHKKI